MHTGGVGQPLGVVVVRRLQTGAAGHRQLAPGRGRRPRQFRQGEAPLRRPRHMGSAAGPGDVLRRRLQESGRHGHRLGPDLLHRRPDGGAARHRPPAAPGADAVGDAGRVAQAHLHPLHRDLQEGGADLCQHGLVPLPLGADAGGDADGAAVVHPHHGALVGALRRALHVAAQAEAQVAPGGPGGRLLGPEGRQVDGREHVAQQPLVVAAVVDHRPAAGVDQAGVVGKAAHQVATPHLRRLQAQGAGAAVDQPLQGQGRLGPAGATVGDDGHFVGKDRDELRRPVGDAIGAGQAVHRRGGHPGGVGGVGAVVVDEAVAHGQNRPVAPQGQVKGVHLPAPVGRGQEVLAAVLRPLHRLPRLQGQPGAEHLFRVETELAAEAAAHVGRHHPHALLGAAEPLRQQAADAVGHLGRRPDRQQVGHRVVGRQHAPPLHRHRGGPAAADLAGHHHVGGGEGRLRVAQPVLPAGHHVVGTAGMQRRGGQGRPGVDQRRQGFVGHSDLVEGVFRHVAVIGQDHGHGLAGIADPVRGQGPLRHARHLARRRHHHRQGLVGRAQVERRPHPMHAGQGRRRGDVDTQHPGVGVGAAQEGGGQGAGQAQVGNKVAPPPQEPLVLAPGQWGANDRVIHRVLPVTSSICKCTPRRKRSPAQVNCAPRDPDIENIVIPFISKNVICSASVRGRTGESCLRRQTDCLCGQ